MPEVLCLDENPDETLRFLSLMRRRILDHTIQVKGRGPRPRGVPVISSYFDFSTMRRIGVSAALVIAALFDRQKRITSWKLSTIDEHKWDRDVVAVFRAVGFHELLEMRPSGDATLDLGQFRVLRFVSGHNADGQLVSTVQDALTALLPEEEAAKLLFAEAYGGMLEAVLNSSTWAYPDGHVWPEPAVERWWMTGAVDLRNNTVSISVLDQGVTIPVSLPNWTHWNQVQQRLNRLGERLGFVGESDDPRNDGAAIALATKVAKSSTQLPQHGKGLNTMLEVAERAKHGRLRILSRFGEYTWERGKKATIKARQDALDGTLVEWTLVL